MIKQRTIKNSVTATGIGLHTGKKVYLALHPMPDDSGIAFKRSDIVGSDPIKVSATAVIDTQLATKIATDKDSKVTVSTVEHLMAALAGLGIDNILIEVSAPEIPIMDGSAAPFAYLIQSAGIIEQSKPKQFIRIKKPVSIKEGDKTAQLVPYDGFNLDFTIAFDHSVLKRTSSHVNCEFSSKLFLEEFSRARTFGFMRDLEKMREHNLALGGNLDNAVVIDDYRILNESGLRYPDEFVRHKLLDAVGDLYMLGYPIIGKFIGYKAGHMMNNLLVRALMDTPNAYEFVTFGEKKEQSPISFALPSFA